MHFFDRLKSSQFLRHNAIFFIGAIAVGALNYVYYPVLGRLLTPASFGEVQTLVSLFLQLTIFLNVVSLITVNIIANARNQEHAARTIIDFEKAATLFGLGLLIVSIIAAPWLQALLRFESGWPFVLLGMAFIVSVPFTFRTSYLRGKQRFGAASLSNILVAGAKLVCSAALVAVGLGTFGAILGLVGAQIFALGFAVIQARKHGFIRVDFKNYLTWPSIERLKPELGYAGVVLVVSLAITLQYSVDILFVKHYFDPHVAGLYAGIAAVARIVFFATASIVQVMIPAIKLAQSPKKNRAILTKSALLLVGIGGCFWLLCVSMPDVVVSTLMGSSYAQLAHVLPNLASSIFVISVLNLIMAYFTALRRRAVAIVGIIGSAVTFCVMLLHHNSVEAVVDSMLLGSLAMGVIVVLWVTGTKLKRGVHAAATHFGHRTGL